jgi:toluene-4-monooxygenase system protein B
MMALPLYAFVEGDTTGILILADEHESVQSLKDKVRDAVDLRVEVSAEMEVVYRGTVLDPATNLADAQFAPLQRFDLRRRCHGVSEDCDNR